MIKLFNDDCLKVLPTLERGSIDLVVTSPPYDNLRNYEDSLEWNFDIFKKVANELYGVLKEGGVIVWVVNDATINGSETGTSFRQALYFKEIGFNLHDTMIYHKKGTPYPQSNRYYNCFEYMFILRKRKTKTTNLLKKKNKGYGRKVTTTERQVDGSVRKSAGLIQGKFVKKYGVRSNIWSYAVGKGNSSKGEIAFQHPAIFPLQLAKDHILSWSNPNDTVLDCFMGSGTTGVASRGLNRNFIGIEKVKEYYDISVKRIYGIEK